jgi:hypothetical protein
MTTITERPHSTSFSKNEIRYIFEVSDPATAGCAVDVEIYYHGITATGDGSKLVSFTLIPTADGLIYCHVASYLRDIVALQLPSTGGNLVQPIDDQVKVFFIKYRQVTTADPEPVWTSDIASKKKVLLGGLEQIKFKRNNYFVSYLLTNKNFLTWQPSNRYVQLDQLSFLTFLLTTLQASITVRYKVFYTDGTFIVNDNAHALAGDANILFRIRTGVKDAGLDVLSNKQIFYYDVSVLGEDGTTILAAPYRYRLNYTYLYSFSDFIFFSSLGGLDSLRASGEVSRTIERNSEEAEHIIYKDDHASDRPQHQFSQTNNFRRDDYKGDAGWSSTKAEQEALIELEISGGIYEVIDGRWIRVLNLKKSTELGSSTDKKWSYPIEWNYGYEETVFTPKKILLGAGTAPISTCAPSGITWEAVDNLDGTQNISFSFTPGTNPTFLASLVISRSTDGVTYTNAVTRDNASPQLVIAPLGVYYFKFSIILGCSGQAVIEEVGIV